MRLASSRSLLEEMKVVFYEADVTSAPDPVYQVFTDLGDHFWINKTVIAAGRLGNEYPKTFGHYHGANIDEKYYVAQGKGILQLQSDNEVFLIKAGVGDEVIIKPKYGHSWSNVGDKELVLFDNWSTPHSPADYEQIEKMHGMAYYIVEDGGDTKVIANKNYKDLPSPVWMTAKEFEHE